MKIPGAIVLDHLLCSLFGKNIFPNALETIRSGWNIVEIPFEPPKKHPEYESSVGRLVIVFVVFIVIGDENQHSI